MMKKTQRTLQACSLKHSIKKHVFCFGQNELILVGQWGSPTLSNPLATCLPKTPPQTNQNILRRFLNYPRNSFMSLLLSLKSNKIPTTSIFGETKEENSITWNQHCAPTVLPLLILLTDFFHKKKIFLRGVL